MEEIKVESSVTDDLINEIADILNTPAGQRMRLERRATIASSNKPSDQLHRLRQYQFGPPLAAGYDPESATPAQASPKPDDQLQRNQSLFGPPLAGGYDRENTTPA